MTESHLKYFQSSLFEARRKNPKNIILTFTTKSKNIQGCCVDTTTTRLFKRLN